MTNCLLTVLTSLSLLCNDSHDVTSLSSWGPYSKQYSGISHVEAVESGRRVDFSVIPGFYRRSYSVPNVLFETNCLPWKVDPLMKRITYRYELEWKDRVYVDATYHILDENNVLVQMECVNNTSVTQNLLLHNSSSTHYAEDYPTVRLKGAEGVQCLYGVDYKEYEPAVRRHDYGLVYDGWMRGEKRDSKSLSGSVVVTAGDPGDKLVYSFSHPAVTGAVLKIRYKASEDVEVAFKGLVTCPYTFVRTEGYAVVSIPCTDASQAMLELVTSSKGSLTIDVLMLGDAKTIAAVEVVDAPASYRPKVEISKGNYIVKYDDVKSYYGVAWNWPMSEVRQFANSELDVFMRRAVHRHPPKFFNGDKGGHHTAAFMRPIFLKPMSDTTLFSLITCGSKDEVTLAVNEFNSNPQKYISRVSPHEEDTSLLPQAAPYSFGQQIFQATIMTNVVYPVYTQKQYIRHFTPGKNWNSLYTWDLGFISWAFNDLDPVKAFETIKAYTIEPGGQSAFIHHGTPLPIQFFAFSDLLTKAGSDEMMEFMYPRLKRYYEYVMGKTGSTTMMPSGLIRTWDYFYSTGGWDDYPPQHELRTERHLYPHVAPMVSSSYYLRAAKILRMIASHLGYTKDVKVYDKDIKGLSSAILGSAWDKEAGYFGYVMHDESGKPQGIYRHSDGSNFNMGLDGVSPLVAGICPEEIRSVLIDNIFSPEKLWTDSGISTVDQSASYFSVDGS